MRKVFMQYGHGNWRELGTKNDFKDLKEILIKYKDWEVEGLGADHLILKKENPSRRDSA